jgi:hypothetical protein
LLSHALVRLTPLSPALVLDRSTHRPPRNESSPPLSRKNRTNSRKKATPAPLQQLVIQYLIATRLIINTTLAGVAQSVERVALMTAKRSTSRSWVRAPPSAIPISQAQQSSCSFTFLLGGEGLGEASFWRV